MRRSKPGKEGVHPPAATKPHGLWHLTHACELTVFPVVSGVSTRIPPFGGVGSGPQALYLTQKRDAHPGARGVSASGVYRPASAGLASLAPCPGDRLGRLHAGERGARFARPVPWRAPRASTRRRARGSLRSPRAPATVSGDYTPASADPGEPEGGFILSAGFRRFPPLSAAFRK